MPEARNASLQALRGAAAVSVMVYHAAHFSSLKSGSAWLGEVFSGKFGFYGVLAFFVLSGFLMEGAVRRYDAKTFLMHRFVRLFPTYWLLFFMFFLLQSLRSGQWQDIPWKALSLLPLGEMYRPLHVEWTLIYEVFFYAVCALLCFWKRVQAYFHLAWLLVVAIAVFQHSQYGSVQQPTLSEIPFSVWNVGFICGALASRIRRETTLSPALLVLFGVALVLIGELAGAASKLFMASPGLALVVLAIARSGDRPARAPGPLFAVFALLGEFSYGLYLVHSLAIQIALQYVPESVITEPFALFTGMLGVGLAAGCVAGMLDVALYRRLKRAVDARWSGPTRTVGAASGETG